jgi:Tlde1 domain
MSKRMRAFGPAVHNRRKPSRKGIPQYFLGSVAVAGLVLGCAWTVYTNVFGANVYPSVSSAAFEAPAVKNPTTEAARPVRPAFNEIFASLEQRPLVMPAPENVASSLMFNERFAASAAQGEPSRSVGSQPAEATKLAAASPPAEAPKAVQASKPAETPKPKVSAPATKLALNAPATAKEADAKTADDKTAKASSGTTVRDMAQRAKAAVMSIASNDKQTMVEKLWGKQPAAGGFLAYASADASVTGSIIDTRSQNPMMGGAPPYDRQTAVYDIAAKTVYLPDGTRLEAHSGLGSKMDDVRYSHVRMQGVTPPHIYELKPREALFHGVPALRLTPIGGEEKIHGRDGLLAHSYMLGPSGQSNGCVSFKDYYAFLDAYKNKGIRRLAVLAKVQ